MDTERDEANEALLRDMIAQGSAAVSLFLNDTDGLEGEGEAGYGYQKWRRKDMIMMAPVTQWRYKKETVLTAPDTEPSPARYIYILVKPMLTS